VRLNVEIDGPQHNTPAARRDDATRDRILAAAGYTTLRFTDEDVKYRPLDVLKAVSEWVSNQATRHAA
jgi:very-short-patch-repair endonuclease